MKAAFKGYFYPSLMSDRNEPRLLRGRGQGTGPRAGLLRLSAAARAVPPAPGLPSPAASSFQQEK